MRLRVYGFFSGIFLLYFATLSHGLAQNDCGCDHTITAGASLNGIKASDFDYSPGDVFCIEGGKYSSFRFSDFIGEAGNPLIFKNCNGVVEIDAPTYSAIQFLGSKYIRLTGTGDETVPLGFKVLSTKSGVSGVSISGLSSHFEIDHLEITNTGFAGIIAKTDPQCDDPSTWRENFLMEDIKIHDNYIHDTGGEGMYIGGTFGYESSSRVCDGQQIFAHLIHGIEIYNNKIERTGWDGLQVSLGERNVSIYNNQIINYGLKLENNQNYGLAIGAGTSVKAYNNFILQSDANHTDLQRGISVINALTNTKFYNNVVVNPGGDGIWMHIRMSNAFIGDLSEAYYFMNNTIITPGRSGIFYNTSIPGGGGARGDLKNAFYNNLIVDPGNNYENSGFWKTADEAFIDFNEKEQRDQATKSNNLFSRAANELQFAGASDYDYSLLAGSPAIDAGKDVSALGVTFDFLGASRPFNAIFDIGAYEFGAQIITGSIPTVDGIRYNLVRSYYPNPVKHELYIETSGIALSAATLKIYGIDGQLIAGSEALKVNGDKEINRIDLSNIALVRGMYWLQISAQGKTELLKLVVE